MAAQDPHGVPAAQDDLLGEAATNEGIDPTAGPVTPEADEPAAGRGATGDGEAKPGKDENQAGFLKDSDKRCAP